MLYRANLEENVKGIEMNRLSNLRGQARPLLRGCFRAAPACGANQKLRSIAGRLRAFLCFGGWGQSLVETALVLLMMMSLIVGVFWLGISIYDYQQLGAAVTQGVTTLAQGQNMGSNPCPNAVTVVTNDIQNMIGSNGSLSVTIYENGAVVAPGLCPSVLASGTKVGVMATYQYTLPGISMGTASCCTLAISSTQTTP